ncbi:hypothetical protein [Actinokineospora sp.]|uniref:hypothetical protein n=1 Tax=Actinokineospora sp. TaxID=1872133 RepID=UPI004037FA0C
MCEQIKASMATHNDSDTGLIPNTVRRWEIGERWPEPRFRKHLVLIFGKAASDLGILTPDELALRPADEEPFELARRLLAMVSPTTGDPGFSRHLFLRGLLGASLLPVIAPLGASASTADVLAHAMTNATGPDARTVAAYAEISTRQRELYWTAPAHAVYESALSHTQLGIQILRGTGSDEMQRRLAAALAESALLSARIAFFDLRQEAVAQRCFDVAREATERAGDHALAAAVFAHMSFVPGFNGNRASAESLLHAAHGHARYDAGPGMRSWLHCVAAEVTARTGDPAASLNHVRQAQDSLSTSGTDPVWLDFYDESRLAGFTGYSQLLAGKPAEAATSLETALDGLDSTNTKQAAVVLFDLAVAHAAEDVERAASYVGRAFDALEHDWYAAAAGRIPRVGAVLRGTPYLAELQERAMAIPPSGAS